MAGALIGILSGAALGFGANEVRQKHEQRQQLAQLIMQSGNADIIGQPESQKVIGDVVGKEGAQLVLGMAKHHQASQQAGMQGYGAAMGGEVAPPSRNAQGLLDPTQTIADLTQQYQHGTKFLGSPEYMGLDESTKKQLNVEKHLESIQKEIADLVKSDPSGKVAAAAAVANAKIPAEEKLIQDRKAASSELIGERAGVEKGLIGERESASLDEARTKKKEGLTGGEGATGKKPTDPIMEANRAGVLLDKLQKTADKNFADKEPHFWSRDEHLKWQADKTAWVAKEAAKVGVDASTGLPISADSGDASGGSSLDAARKKLGL